LGLALFIGQAFLAVHAERRTLEEIATPLSAQL
jgi:hypothetical protein